MASVGAKIDAGAILQGRSLVQKMTQGIRRESYGRYGQTVDNYRNERAIRPQYGASSR